MTAATTTTMMRGFVERLGLATRSIKQRGATQGAGRHRGRSYPPFPRSRAGNDGGFGREDGAGTAPVAGLAVTPGSARGGRWQKREATRNTEAQWVRFLLLECRMVHLIPRSYPLLPCSRKASLGTTAGLLERIRLSHGGEACDVEEGSRVGLRTTRSTGSNA